MQNYRITQKGAVTRLETDDNAKLFITSDVHFDSVFSHRKQFFADMDEAIKHGAKILIIGDFFDLMNGRFDPRRSMTHLRPEYRREDYYDIVITDAAKKLQPYAKHILMITDGNHELSVLKNANTDPVGRLTEMLTTPDHKVFRGGYGGNISFVQPKKRTPIKYFHGSGGEAPVTRGAIQTSRQAVFLPDAELVLNGHSHHAYWIPITRERISASHNQFFDIQHHVRTPGYNMAWGDGSSGWEVTRGGVPKPMGSFMIYIMSGKIIPIPMINPPKPMSSIMDIYNGITFPQE